MAQSSEIKLLKRFDQDVEITGTLTVGGVSVTPSSYLTSIPVPQNGNWWNLGYVRVGGDGVMEMGKYMDFHTSDSGGSADYDLRVTVSPGTFTVGGVIAATGGNSGQWNTAYGWGNHASAGYLTSLPSHTHSASDITSGTLSGDRLPWANNDGFTGTYPLVWKAANTPYTASWLNVNGATDTLNTVNLYTSGAIGSSGALTVTDTSTGVYVDTAGHASVRIDRGSTSFDNNLLFYTAGVLDWRLWQDGSSDYLYIRDETNSKNLVTFTKGTTGSVTIDGNFNAHNFYDYNNSNYFVNPSTTERSIRTAGYITAGYGNSKGFEVGAGGCHITAVGLGDVVFQGASQLRFGPANYDWNQWGGIKYTGGSTPVLYIGGPASSVFTSNASPPSTEINFTGTTLVYADSSFRAPIFYDSDNTGYYVNPAGTSRLGFGIFDGYDGATGNNSRLSTGVSIGRYTSEYAYIEIASSNAGGGWIDFNQADGTDYLGRIRYHNGSNYMRFWAGGNEEFNIYSSYTLALGSSRAPIFYDSDNTGFYLNPSSTTSIYDLIVGSGLQIAGRSWAGDLGVGLNYVASDPTSTGSRANYGAGIWTYSGYSTGTNRPHTYDATIQIMPDSNRGFELSADWVSSSKTPLKIRSLRDCCQGWSPWREVMTAEHTNSGNFLTSGSMRADRFYDVNDTSYYIEPNGTSKINAVQFFGAFFHDTNNRNEGMFGSYDSTKTDHIWSMGTAYRNAADGSNFGNLYGLAYKHTNNGTGGTMGGGHQMVWCNNGTPRGAIGYDRVWHAGDMQAGGNMFANNFYDDDNTSFYINPAGVSNINELHGNGKEIFDATDDSYLRINQSASFSSGIWFGDSNRHGGNTFITVGGNGGTTSSRVYIYGGAYTGTNVIKIDGNSGIIQTTTDSMRAPRFYDYDNTSYYLDAASTSRLNQVDANYLDVVSNAAYALRFWSGSNNYSIRMSESSNTTYGGRMAGETTSDYNMYFTMAAGTNRGFVFNNGLANAVAGIDASGNGRFKGDVVAYSTSDKRFKDNITPIDNAIDKVQKISGVTFDWNDKQDTYEHGKHDVGVIAQEIEEVLPEVVDTRENGYKAVKYEKIVPLLIEAIKEQQKQIDELKSLINKS